jgi:ElaB/YqjD/DUF883 family membrane-anchored ribosome-binding protein
MAFWSRGTADDISDEIEHLQGRLASLTSAIGRNAERSTRGLRQSASSTAGNAQDQLSSTAHELKNQLDGLLSAVQSTSGALARDARERGSLAYHNVEEKLEDNAVIAVVAALGIGVLLGTLLGRTTAPEQQPPNRRR